ncbi:Dynein light chain 1 cytoplasmic [Fasciola hepatica]|uniref:Dynein light chain n=1 Tax=Fasciola hepatica TaxID=6192 RepID=A0A2H1C3P0_FASHE|nr:Dynein light chain 1 cytoplasmic [Fasciola hepatica]
MTGTTGNTTDLKAVIKHAEMDEKMQQDALEMAAQALSKYQTDKDTASFMKHEFDKKYKPIWNCIVGRDFGSFITHRTEHLIYFYMGDRAFLLFRSA